MQHCPAQAARQLAAAALALVLLLALAAPRAHAALQEKHGIRLLTFDHSQILSIGNQTSGKCSWYALRYARTILDGRVCSGSGMWSNGAVWSAGGYTGYSGDLSACLHTIYNELSAGRAPEKHHGERCEQTRQPHLYLRVSPVRLRLDPGELPAHCHQRHLWTLGLCGGHKPHGRPR